MKDESPKLPARVQPMMLAHLVTTGDVAQHREWRARVEAIEQIEAAEAATDPDERSLLLQDAAFRQMRATGARGALLGLAGSSMWMAWLIPVYAIGHGFGWLAASSFLLPVPLAWRVGRRLWERASLRGMLHRRKRRRGRFGHAVRSSFGAGFGLGFTLVFLQALLTWFMTPAATFGLEIALDLFHATLGGLASGTLASFASGMAALPAPGDPRE